VDMVILSIGMEPRADAKDTGKLFGISCSSDGWFMERHPKLDPISTMTEGIFIAGCATGPKDIPGSVSQGAAAAARVLDKILQKEVELEPIRATVNENKCSGCRICNALCPFSAISFLPELGVTRIKPGSLPGLRYLCGGLPGGCHQRHRL